MKRHSPVFAILIVLALLASSFQPALAAHTLGFAAAVNYAAPDPIHVNTADLDKDGDMDLITANYGTNNASVYLNDGAGVFVLNNSYGTGNVPNSVVAADVNNDTILDLLTSNQGNDSIVGWLGVGGGAFNTTSFTHAVGDSPRFVTAAYLNNDVYIDLVTANSDSNNVSVLLGAGNNTFNRVDYTVGSGNNAPRSVVAGDMDNDGDLDLVTAELSSGNVNVLLNNGFGVFGAATSYTMGVGATSSYAAVADLNNDGHVDVVANVDSLDVVAVLMNNGSGGLGTAVTYAVGDAPRYVTPTDLDDDGDLDLAVANQSGSNISILVNNGSGGFGAATNYATGTKPTSISAADLDGDGDPDLAVSNWNSSTVSVLINRSTIEIADTTDGTATNNGTVAKGEYVGYTYGINDGFGGVIGTGSTLHVDSSSAGLLNFGLVRGSTDFGANMMVIYIDADRSGANGGFADTSTFTDNADQCRKAVSGYDTPAQKSVLTFASGFKADYALCLKPNTSYAGLFQLVSGGSHTYVTTANYQNNGTNYEMNLTLANLGLTPGASFDYVATLISDTASRSNEFNGVTSYSGSNPGWNPVNLAAGDYHTFVSVPCAAQASGNWSNFSTWDCGVVPQAGYDVTIPSLIEVTLDVDTADIHDLTLLGTLKNDGTAHTLSMTGNWTNNGGTFTPGTYVTVKLDGFNHTIGGSQATTFYNLTIDGPDGSTPTVINIGDEAHEPKINGVFDYSSRTANPIVFNQTLNVPYVSSPVDYYTRFLHLTNSANTTTKYQGVDLQPVASNLGTVTVSILLRRNLESDSCTGSAADAVKGNHALRCFQITPLGTSPYPSTNLGFWFETAENNDIYDGNQSAVTVYHKTPAGIMEDLGGYTTGPVSGYNYTGEAATSSFSPFMLSGADPTSVELVDISARPASIPTAAPILLGAAAFLTGGILAFRKLRRR